MATAKKILRRTVRRSVSLSADIDHKVQVIARHENRSANRVIETLIETGLEAKEAEKRRFFDLAERLRSATDAAEIQQLKSELARMTFGA